ncbi:unnamed protein product [Somion occarium]|uniref:Uncharacterized protein n=1 Tax=Somion occarium TaxID=3059160 RepID=A0ABP1DI87_9APHY
MAGHFVFIFVFPPPLRSHEVVYIPEPLHLSQRPMRFYYGRYLQELLSVHYDFRDLDLTTGGTWTLITPEMNCLHILPGICHKSYPLGKVKNEETAKVVSRIESDTRKWLLLDCVKPVKMASRLSLRDHSLTLQNTTFSPSIADLELDTMRVLLDASKQVAEYHLSWWNKTHKHRTFHIDWIEEGEIESVRLTDPLSVFINTILERRAHRASLVRLMRAPGPYDGGADFVFEKYMKVAISLLFDTDHLVLLSCEGQVQDLPPCSSQNCFPLVVAVHLVQKHRHSQETTSETALPKHCVLYGLHWSRTHLRIFVHFPICTMGEDPTGWKFGQALAAQHWVALEQVHPERVSSHCNSQDTFFLGRWRMTVALFAIRARIHELEQLLTDIHMPKMIPQMQSQPASPGSDQTLAKFEPRSSSISHYVHAMRRFWRDRQIEVPEEWIPAEEEVVAVVPTR